jgi:hypothetical protein
LAYQLWERCNANAHLPLKVDIGDSCLNELQSSFAFPSNWFFRERGVE